MKRPPKQPPIDNRFVAPGCEPFASKPRTRKQRDDNPPLHLKMEPSPGSDISDCYDHAAKIVRKVGCVVNFEFNEVFCGVRPADVFGECCEDSHDIFVRNYHRELAKKTGCKICYANP